MENNQANRKFNPLIVALFLLIAIVLSFGIINGLYARFTSGDNIEHEARVAAFNVTGDGFSQQINFNVSMNPGDQQLATIQITNESEVSVRYTASIVNSTCNLPLKLDLGGGYYHDLDSEFSFSDDLSPNGVAQTYYAMIVWDSADNEIEYSGMLDDIVIKVSAVQID